MLDFDKWPTLLQMASIIGVFAGGIIAAVFGGRKKPDSVDRQRDDREREERSKRYQVERLLEIERLERRFEAVIQALRESVLGKIEEQQESWREEFKAINARMAAVEREIETPHPRRPRQ